MTVYVDDVRIPARVGRLEARWSHLTVGPDDDIAELHAFAARIGLRRSWFQDKKWPRAHYDVTESKRQEAIRAGAVAITWEVGGRMRNEAIARRRAGIEARQWQPGDPAAIGEMVGWLMVHGVPFHHPDGIGSTTTLAIQTTDGEKVAQPGDWIVKDARGEFYPYEAGRFRAAQPGIEATP
jgi:Protein of unknown function (DUF4031)